MMRPQRRGDEGASLIFALVIVMVFSLIVAAVLTFAETSLRSTIVLRDQAQQTAAADGAAQIAINTLRRGGYDGSTGDCFTTGATTTDTLPLPSFYRSSSGGTDSAVVTCSPETSSGPVATAINDKNTPRNAILVGAPGSTGAGTEGGLLVDLGAGQDFKVHGSVFSNESVVATGGSITSDASVTARGPCTGAVNGTPPRVCDIHGAVDPRGDNPAYPVSGGAPAAKAPEECTDENLLIEFDPGVYTDIEALNNMKRCLHSIFHFNPGTYYFNFDKNEAWTIKQDYVVGGTSKTKLVAGTPPAMPGSCESPVPSTTATGPWTPPDADHGVQFVFGGTSRIVLENSQMELCGSYSGTDAPVALYGLTTNTNGVPAQSGCTVDTPYPTSGCATLKVDSGSKLHIQGTTYLPNGALDVALANPAAPAFSDGVIARTLQIAPTAGASLATAVISLPDRPGRHLVVNLDVYVCPDTGTCSAGTGTRRLRAKVGVADPSGIAVPGAREITIYSWAVER